MEIQIGYFPQVFLLVVARFAAIIGTVPFFGGQNIPAQLRAAIIIVVAVAVLPFIPVEWAESVIQMRTMPQILFAILNEVLLGAGIGLVCHFFLGMCTLAGMIGGWGSSLTMAESMNPIDGTSSPVLGQLLQMVFVLLVLLCDGHLVLLKFTAMSFSTISSSTAWINGDFAETILEMSSMMFEWGLRLAMPILCTALLLDVGLGLIARMAPDFDVLFLSLPVRVFVGVAVFGLVLRVSAEFMNGAIEHMLTGCGKLLGG